MTNFSPLHTLDLIKKLRSPARNNEIDRKEKLTRLEKLALVVSEKVGTMGFFMIIFSWTVLWLAWNTFAPVTLRFDSFPGFVLWLFISNVIQLILMPLIMVGQNIQGKHADARSESDFELNVKGQIEIEKILHRLERQNASILEKINNPEN
jgi:uncharacterized membrane protein